MVMLVAGESDEEDGAVGADCVERFCQQRQHGERGPGDCGRIVVLGPREAGAHKDHAVAAARDGAQYHLLRRTWYGLLDNLIRRNSGFDVLLSERGRPIFGRGRRLQPLLYDLRAYTEVGDRLGTLGRAATD